MTKPYHISPTGRIIRPFDSLWPTMDQFEGIASPFVEDDEFVQEFEKQQEIFFQMGRQVGKPLMTQMAFWEWLGLSPALKRVLLAVWERMMHLEELYHAVEELDLLDDFQDEPHPIFGNEEEILARRRVCNALEAVWENNPPEEDFEDEGD